MSADAFEAIWRQAAAADSQGRAMHANVTLVGDSLPDCPGRIDLKNFDVTKDRRYAVGSFEIRGGDVDHLRGRIRPIEGRQDEGYDTSIGILITETSYKLSAVYGWPYSLSCEGRAIGRPFDGATATVAFFDHRRAGSDYEVRSFFGEFSYRCESESFPKRFDFNLWYVSENDWKLLASLLTRGTDTRVFLTVNLTNENDELRAATDELRGNVRDYSLEIFRKFGD